MIEFGPESLPARSKLQAAAARDGKAPRASASSDVLPGGQIRGWFAAIAIAMGWIFLAICLAAGDVQAEHKEDGIDRERRPRSGWDDLRAERQAERSDRRVQVDRAAGDHRERAGSARDQAEREHRRDAYRGRDGDREHPRRQRMRTLRKALPEFSRVERKLILRRARELPETEREALRQRVSRIDQLEPAERSALEAELRGMIADQPEERQRLEGNVRRWEGMSDSERDEMRRQMRRFRELPADKRREMLNQWAPEGSRSGRDLRSDDAESAGKHAEKRARKREKHRPKQRKQRDDQESAADSWGSNE